MKFQTPRECVSCETKDSCVAVGFLTYWCQSCGALDVETGKTITIYKPTMEHIKK